MAPDGLRSGEQMYGAEINTSTLLFHHPVQTLAANDTSSRWHRSPPSRKRILFSRSLSGLKATGAQLWCSGVCTFTGRLFRRSNVSATLEHQQRLDAEKAKRALMDGGVSEEAEECSLKSCM